MVEAIWNTGKPLVIFDIANNHNSSVAHGLNIIRGVTNAVNGYDCNFAFKLQYRHLEDFIHPDYQNRMDIKYIKRFSETRLSADQYKQLKDAITEAGFISICTPFDEKSVDLLGEHGFDIIKVASCSCNDWPLLERIARTDRPIIVSTASIPLEELDKVVSFLEHRNKEFALMHCVAEYPTSYEHLRLNMIDVLKARYPKITIGFSTHESPDNYDAVKIAVAKGCRIFEKHVGLGQVNGYSAIPVQVSYWLKAMEQAFKACEVGEVSTKELSELHALQRGLFANRFIKQGERIKQSDVFMAIPTVGGHVVANDFSKYREYTATQGIETGKPLLRGNTKCVDTREKIYKIAENVCSILMASGLNIPQKIDMEISHHYGLDRFYDYGLVLFNVVNREYCKKILVLLPGQQHPEQLHKVKEETFHVLYGDINLLLDSTMANLSYGAGEVITIPRNTKHSFSTTKGAVIEEISSTHFKDDSYYTDPAITENKDRKTQLTYWRVM